MKLQDLIINSKEKLAAPIKELFTQLPFQLLELWVHRPAEGSFVCCFCMIKREDEGIYFWGEGHRNPLLNELGHSQGQLWDLMSKGVGSPSEYFDDIAYPNQLGFSLYNELLQKQDNNFQLINNEYPNVFVFNIAKQIYRLRDLCIVRLCEADGEIAGIIRLFNHIGRTRDAALSQQKIVSYVNQILFRLSVVSLAANVKPKEVKCLGKVSTKNGIVNLCSANPHLKDLFDFLLRAAATDETILIWGDSGVGKEIFARAIHQHSPRNTKPFVDFSCVAIPPTLIEAELFGANKGAYADRRTDHKGYFEVAEDGSLFIDEIGELPPEVQVKLLRALQEKEFRRLGSTKKIELRARILAATNKDLEEEVRNGRFRKDLYHRLDILSLRIPALRDRKEDIPLILDDLIKRPNISIRLSDEAKLNLIQRNWSQNNVRELENYLIKLRSFAEDPQNVTAFDLKRLDQSRNQKMSSSNFDPQEALEWAQSLSMNLGKDANLLDIIKGRLVQQAVEMCGNKAAAARYLGVVEGTIYNILEMNKRLFTRDSNEEKKK